MSSTESLIHEIEAYVRSRGIAETTFGRLAVNDGKFVARIRAGGRMLTDTERRVRQFMASHPQCVVGQ